MSFPPHMPMIPPIPFFPPNPSMMIPPNMATPPPGIPTPANGVTRTGESDKKTRQQAPTTVFVGSISDRAPDVMIKRMLQHCGSIVNWKRVQGANGRLQAFGFCEYEHPEGTLRCIRLLNGWQIQDKQLVVKVDAKTKVLLDEFKKKKRQELAKKAANDTTAFKFIYEDDEDGAEDTKKGNSTDGDTKKKSGEEGEIEEEEDDYLDEATRREDHTIRQSLETVMREYSREMNQRALEAKEAAAREAQATALANPPMPPPMPMNNSLSPGSESTMNPGSTSPVGRRGEAAALIDDEEGKRSLITNEIQMFRDRFKDEDTKMRNTEKERKDRYERERALQREKRQAQDTGTNGSGQSNVSPSDRDGSRRSTSRDRSPSKHERERDRDRDRDRDRSNTNRRDRSSPSDDRYRNSSSRSNTSNSVRSRTGADRRSPPTSRYDRRPSPPPVRSYPRRSLSKSPVSKGHSHEEDDDETYERKRQERRLKEKELHYRELLKKWEQRERKKESDYEQEKRRELARLRDEEKEGKRLLAFLEDYNDETEDPKFYKGTALARRLKDREHEIEADNRDRRREKEEIDELRQKLLLQDNITDIEAEIKRRLEKEEENVRRRMADLIRTSSEESSGESDNDDGNSANSLKENVPLSSEGLSKDIDNTDGLARATNRGDSPKPDVKTSPRQTSALGGVPITGTKLPSKRKLAVNEAFRDDQDDDGTNGYQKKSKLSALPDESNSLSAQGSPHLKDDQSMRLTPGKLSSANAAAAAASSAQAQEERRQAVRQLIESIPTKREDLFTYPLDWSLLDSNLMERRIRPWITKKIVEYIGEEEATLTDFICSSITSKSPESILNDIRVVLDDEAEVFVVKMWRLIVYEIEAKRKGLSK